MKKQRVSGTRKRQVVDVVGTISLVHCTWGRSGERRCEKYTRFSSTKRDGVHWKLSLPYKTFFFSFSLFIQRRNDAWPARRLKHFAKLFVRATRSQASSSDLVRSPSPSSGGKRRSFKFRTRLFESDSAYCDTDKRDTVGSLNEKSDGKYCCRIKYARDRASLWTMGRQWISDRTYNRP